MESLLYHYVTPTSNLNAISLTSWDTQHRGVVVTIREMPGPILDPEVDYHKQRFSWVSSVLPRKFRATNNKQRPTFSF